jgi:nitrite reductase/ring-hydroxylating ferredoxin subunit
MQRRLVMKVLGIGALLQFFSVAQAATGPTIKCTRVGQQIVWRGKKYTCIKSGKTLIWDKGVVIPTATPSAKSTPSATPHSATPTPAQPTPTPTQSASKVPYTGTVVGKSSDLSMGESKIFSEPDAYGRGFKFVVTRKPSGLVAFSNICTHEGCAVDVLVKNQLQCPCHGAQFDAVTGAATRAPAYEGLRPYRVEERSGEIVIWIY